MKKILLSGAAIALLATVMVSCGENKETKTETTTTTTTEAEKPAETAATTPAASDAPTFSNEEVNKGLAEFKALKDQYVAAIASKDQAKIAELNKTYTTWAQGAASWGTKLKPEELQSYTDYMTKLTKEWSDAAMNAAK